MENKKPIILFLPQEESQRYSLPSIVAPSEKRKKESGGFHTFL